jgi:hypothetical protein
MQTIEAFCLFVQPRCKKASLISPEANQFLLVPLSPANGWRPPAPLSPLRGGVAGGVCPLLTSGGRSPPSPRRSEGCSLLAVGPPPQEARCDSLLLGATYSCHPLRIPVSRTSRSRQGGPTTSSSSPVRLCRPQPLLLSFPYTTAWQTAAASLAVVAYPARRPPSLASSRRIIRIEVARLPPPPPALPFLLRSQAARERSGRPTCVRILHQLLERRSFASLLHLLCARQMKVCLSYFASHCWSRSKVSAEHLVLPDGGNATSRYRYVPSTPRWHELSGRVVTLQVVRFSTEHGFPSNRGVTPGRGILR